MNVTTEQNENLNINVIKSVDDVDFQDHTYKNIAERNGYLHGRKPLKIRFFANGDKFFSGKRISIYSHKYRNIDELMTELTNKMPHHVHLPNGIRQLFTSSGGKRIHEIKELENGKDYVCAGNENYKNISYGKNDKEPWFKGRPQNFSRYPPLLPFGLGPNIDATSNYKSDGQSHYAGQNAFPTRFYRPAGLAYFTKNAAGHFVSNGMSIGHPKLIKFKSKAVHNKNVNYYQNLLNQQSKPKVITVVRNGPEKPKCFVRILLNRRSIQTFETLFSDIESSLRDHSYQRTLGIGKIYNLLGKEIQSIGDFFRNEDFFIAVETNENLNAKQVKDILDDMYPNHPQTNHVLRYWTTKKHIDQFTKTDELDIDKSKIIHISNMSIDKRDSGFEEQNFSNESEFTSFSNINETIDVAPLPKPKVSNSKPIIKKKKTNREKEFSTSIFQNSSESDNQITDVDKIAEVGSNNIYKSIQDTNSERLRAAYEDREKARIQFQNQIKDERKKLENTITNNSSHSQMIRKFISERGSIDVFKRMDEANQEARKQKIREKMEKPPPVVENSYNGIKSVIIVTSEKHSMKDKEPKKLPPIELSVDSSVQSNKEYQISHEQNNKLSPPLGKLNKINEDPSEYYTEDMEPNDINEDQSQIESSSNFQNELENRQRNNNKITDSIDSMKFNENKVIPEGNDFGNENKENNVSHASTELKNELNSKERKDNDKNFSIYPSTIPVADHVDSKTEVKPINSLASEKEPNPDLQILLEPDPKHIPQFELNQNSKLQPKLAETTVNDKLFSENINENISSTITSNTNQKLDSIGSQSPVEKLISNKSLQRSSSLPGTRIIGKLCRQLPSSDIIYQRFEVTKLLGDGNFAVVKLALHRKSKKEYALKIIDKARMVGKESMIENEIWIMKLCNHENIVKLKEEYETKEEVFLVMELVKSGDLFDAITQNVKFSEPIAARMVSDMANALFYLHSRRIVHRDLKPENLMVTHHKDGSINLKLADFGLAMEIKKLIYTVCGTPTYVAPEILTEKGYSLEVDLWALGVITYILLCGFPPFRSTNRDQEQLFELIKSGNFDFISPYWDKISFDVKDLIKKLLVVDRTLRATTIEVLSDKWVMSRSKGISTSNESQKCKRNELEEQAIANLEGFQKQKKELRAILNREIQSVYQIKKNKR